MGIFDFNRAIVRKPGWSVVNGLRDGDRDGPSYSKLRIEHQQYAAALQEAGLRVTTLEALEEYPDSVFVEDPALVFSETAVLLRSGAASRAGEVLALTPTLRANFERVVEIEEGTVDGGDVMVTPDLVVIGLSNRTDRVGAAALSQVLSRLGRRTIVAPTPAGTLHFKTASSMIDEDTVLVTRALANAEVFAGLRKLVVSENETAGANVLRVNDTVLVGAEYPGVIDQLTNHGLKVVPLSGGEIGKLDAGLTCMSLRWKAPN